jgi:twitching motility protein PilT
MRDPETMRLTLNASETGHLVLATIHSSTAVEALQRLVSAFPSEIQNSIAAQLADCLAAVICQRLRYDRNLDIRLPECEVLVPTHAVKNFIRRSEFFQIQSLLETGADHGMWTFARYRAWMEKRRDWYVPPKDQRDPITEEPVPVKRAFMEPPPKTEQTAKPAQPSKSGRIEIEPDEGGLEKILKRLS